VPENVPSNALVAAFAVVTVAAVLPDVIEAKAVAI
jgi:hypothetical protein